MSRIIKPGMFVATSYQTGAYRIIKVKGPCWCASYVATLNERNPKPSRAHLHLTCVAEDVPADRKAREDSQSYLNGVAPKAGADGAHGSVWSQDRYFIAQSLPNVARWLAISNAATNQNKTMHAPLAKSRKTPAATAVRRQTTGADSPRNGAKTDQPAPPNGGKSTHPRYAEPGSGSVETAREMSAQLEELMRAAVHAAGVKDEAAFKRLPKEEQNAFLAQARGQAASPARGSGESGLRLLDPAQVQRSPFNRDDFDQEKLEELIADVKRRGVVQPGMVRPLRPPVVPKSGVPIVYQLIAGERRWRAAKAAGVLFPAVVHDVDDTTALELQAVENLDREDLNAIDEARKYRQLLDAYEGEGGTAAQAMERLEKRIGKKRATIYERLTLLRLPSQTQVLTQRGTLPASHAALLAKVADPAAVVRLAGEIAKPSQRQSHDREGERGVLNFRETKRLVDEELSREKHAAEYNRERTAFQKSGDLILSDAENRKLFPQNWNTTPDSNSGYKSLDQSCDQDASYRTYKVLIGSKVSRLSPVLARLPKGGPLIVYPDNEVKEAVKAAGKLKARGKQVSEETRVANAMKPRRAAFDVALRAALKEIEVTLDSTQFWRFLALAVVGQWRSDPLKRTIKRRGWAKGTEWPKKIAQMGVGELRGLVVEILLWNDVPGPYQSGWGKIILEACALTRVPLPAWSGKAEVRASGNGEEEEF